LEKNIHPTIIANSFYRASQFVSFFKMNFAHVLGAYDMFFCKSRAYFLI
jgi:T-complex protein 1 subunit delta